MQSYLLCFHKISTVIPYITTTRTYLCEQQQQIHSISGPEMYAFSRQICRQKLLSLFIVCFYTHCTIHYTFNFQIIAVTGFEGMERNDLKTLIELSGAKYTGFFSRGNTLLICNR